MTSYSLTVSEYDEYGHAAYRAAGVYDLAADACAAADTAVRDGASWAAVHSGRSGACVYQRVGPSRPLATFKAAPRRRAR